MAAAKGFNKIPEENLVGIFFKCKQCEQKCIESC